MVMTMSEARDTPYCKECGYELTGLTDSSRCPECGRPIVEVLVRASFFGMGKRYTSASTLLGLPLLAIAAGPHGAERFGSPVGFIAIGDKPRGIIAIGGTPVGIVSFGGFARGIISIGGMSVGLVSLGGCSLGALAVGGLAAGVYAFGGLVVAVIDGMGGTVLRLL
jgi:predicted RNA-binding Zn-ribbon protein involved in translation (DUF1610 family)